MRVFISWSGERSKAVAIALKDFIENTIQSVEPFVSDENITSGERWNVRLKEELQKSQYAVLSVTKDNKGSPWLLFEAGALSNSAQNIPVVPFLFDIEPSELTGNPLLQFQATYYNKKDNVKKLIEDINSACGDDKLDTKLLDRAFDKWYVDFENSLSAVTPETDKKPKPDTEADKTRAILEEVLDLTRGNQKLLSNKDMPNSEALKQLTYFLTSPTIYDCYRMKYKRINEKIIHDSKSNDSE
ncbi:hypothetical protein FACS189490_00920 [Clostridia bacterium]|nr:hypothetical protein FACS189490_00920 [Clostridia bacterium]